MVRRFFDPAVVGVPALGSFPTSLGGHFRTLVAHAEQFQNFGHVFRLPNVVAHNVCESGWVRLGSSIGDQLIVDLPREGEVFHAGGVDVPDLPTAEPVDGGRWDQNPPWPRPPLPISLLIPGQLSTSCSTPSRAVRRSCGSPPSRVAGGARRVARRRVKVFYTCGRKSGGGA